MKKAKNTELTTPEDQLEDFNHDDFTDLDEHNAHESEDQATEASSPEFESEFHGADPDLPAEEQVNYTPPIKRNLLDLAKENWLYIGIGLIVIVVALYLLISVFSSESGSTQQAGQTQANAGFNNVPNAASTTANGTTTATTGATTSPAGNIVMSDAQMQQLMQGFSQIVQQNSADLQKSLAAGGSSQELTTMSTNLNSLAASIAKLNQTLTTLQQQLTTTQSQLNTLVGQQGATNQNLTLRAVVPGRAWLVDGEGHTTSVTVGTPLGTAGTVTDIDPTSNTVTTSSGYIFK